MRVHLAPFFGERSIDAIEPEDVIDLVALLERSGRSPATVRRIIATLSGLFVFAKAPYRRWATINPCEGIDLPALREPTEIRYLTLPQVDRLLAHVRPGPFAHLDRAIFTTAVMTGLRKGELVALRWRDIDWGARRIRVRRSYTYGEFGTPKSKRSSRSVPMTAELAIELRRVWNQTIWRDDDDLVFAHPDHGGVLPKANISRRLSAALRAAGIEDHRFHDLRHTFGTRMAAAGVPLRTLQEWMGHRDITTTQRYADYAPSEHEGEMVEAAFQRERGGISSGWRSHRALRGTADSFRPGQAIQKMVLWHPVRKKKQPRRRLTARRPIERTTSARLMCLGTRSRKHFVSHEPLATNTASSRPVHWMLRRR